MPFTHTGGSRLPPVAPGAATFWTLKIDIPRATMSRWWWKFRTRHWPETGSNAASTHERAFQTYWIVNLVDSQLEVFTNPRDTGRAADDSNEAILTRTDVVTMSLPNHVPLEIAVADWVR